MNTRHSTDAFTGLRETGPDYGLSLRRRRTWYAGEPAAAPDTPAAPSGEQPAPAPSAETLNPGTPQEHMIPKSRFDEINARMKKAEDALAEQQRAAEDAERARLAEQGKYQQLYEDATSKATTLETTLKERETALTRYQEAFQAMLTKRLEAAPEHIRALLDKMDALDALTWLDENADKLAPAKPAPPNTNAREGTRTTGSREVTLRKRVTL